MIIRLTSSFGSTDASGRFILFLGLSACAYFATLVVPVPAAMPLLFGASAGLLAMSFILGVTSLWARFSTLIGHRAALSDLRKETRAGVLTDFDGSTLAKNTAVAGFEGLKDGNSIVECLDGLVAMPEDVAFALRDHAVAYGQAQNVVGVAKKVVVSARKVSAGRLLWTFHIHGLGNLSGSGTKQQPERKTDQSMKVTPLYQEANADLLEALPVPILKIAVDGALLEANAQARSILSITEENMPPLFELVEGMGRPISDWLSDAAAGRGLLKSEIVRAVIPGQELYLQIALGRVIEDGEVRLIGILNDATELKTLEAQFVQSQKMQAIGQLAGGVAHDFNNLLTAISGHCDLLLLRHDAGDPDYADLIQISQNANRAASLVGQLLAFSRKQNLKPQALDIRDTMSELAHLLNRLIGEKISLNVTHAPGVQSIRADRRQLEQVIVNLVVNARDAMPDGGTISVSSSTETLSEDLVRDRAHLPAGSYVRIEVADTGVGIAQDGLAKIFEPFYTTKKTGEGTGLGLSTAYGIVKQTGGFIFVESDLGEGTSFILYFPVCHEALPVPKDIAPVKEKSGTQGDGIVLLVEDEAPVRAFASRALRLRGYTVIEAEHAEEALEVLEDPKLEIDIFVSDVVMPGMDGPTWVRKALKTRADTRVIFMSGYSEEGRAEKQARIPNSVFLPKPFSLHQLTTLVHEQLQ